MPESFKLDGLTCEVCGTVLIFARGMKVVTCHKCGHRYEGVVGRGTFNKMRWETYRKLDIEEAKP